MVCPNKSNEAILNSLFAEIGNDNCLNGLVSSATTSSSFFFSSFLDFIDWSKSLESIKVNLAANLLTNSTFSFCSYLTSFASIFDLKSK